MCAARWKTQHNLSALVHGRVCCIGLLQTALSEVMLSQIRSPPIGGQLDPAAMFLYS